MTAPRKLYGVSLKPRVKTPPRKFISPHFWKHDRTCWKRFGEPLPRIGKRSSGHPRVRQPALSTFCPPRAGFRAFSV
jgi:hypothetical protein